MAPLLPPMHKDPELEVLDENESQSSDVDYSRKDKSLRLLCSRFILEYSKSTEVGETEHKFVPLSDQKWLMDAG